MSEHWIKDIRWFAIVTPYSVAWSVTKKEDGSKARAQSVTDKPSVSLWGIPGGEKVSREMFCSISMFMLDLVKVRNAAIAENIKFVPIGGDLYFKLSDIRSFCNRGMMMVKPANFSLDAIEEFILIQVQKIVNREGLAGKIGMTLEPHGPGSWSEPTEAEVAEILKPVTINTRHSQSEA